MAPLYKTNECAENRHGAQTLNERPSLGRHAAGAGPLRGIWSVTRTAGVGRPAGKSGSLWFGGRYEYAHLFHPLSAPRAGLERIRKVLCFPCNFVAVELHDAHGVGGLPVIRKNILGDPNITAANDSPNGEALFARLIGACDLYVAPTADSLA